MATQTSLSLKTIAALRALDESPRTQAVQAFWATPLPPHHPLTPHLNQEKIHKASKALAVQSLCCFTKLLDHLPLARLLSRRLNTEDSELWVQKACESEAMVAMLETFCPWLTDELLLVTETFLRNNLVKGTAAPSQLFLQYYCERLLESFTLLEEICDPSHTEDAVEEIFQKGQELLASGAPLTLPTF